MPKTLRLKFAFHVKSETRRETLILENIRGQNRYQVLKVFDVAVIRLRNDKCIL